MTAHDHSEPVPGCFRCDLSHDETPPRGRRRTTADLPQSFVRKPAQQLLDEINAVLVEAQTPVPPRETPPNPNVRTR